MIAHHSSAAGIVLCGGKSTRMGSPKALLPFGSETMLQRVVRLVGTVTSPVVVVAAAGQLLPELPDSVTLTRDERQGRGPLEGLRAGLKSLPDGVEAAYVTGCDVPLLVPAFVRRMIDLLEDYDIAVMNVDGLLHPLSAVYHCRVLPHIDMLLDRDRLRPVFLYESVRTRRVQPVEVAAEDPHLHSLRNLNTRDDYRKAMSSAAGRRDALREG